MPQISLYVVPFFDLITYVYADIRNETERKGENVGPNDLLMEY